MRFRRDHGRGAACSGGQGQIAKRPASRHAADGVVGQADVAAASRVGGRRQRRDGKVVFIVAVILEEVRCRC